MVEEHHTRRKEQKNKRTKPHNPHQPLPHTTEKPFLVEKKSRCGHTGTEGKIKKQEKEGEEENTGDEKEFRSYVLWEVGGQQH